MDVEGADVEDVVVVLKRDVEVVVAEEFPTEWTQEAHRGARGRHTEEARAASSGGGSTEVRAPRGG
jgi:hypothetical protein